jgi:hypothetical protein
MKEEKKDLDFFDELYAEILSHDKVTVITEMRSCDRTFDRWITIESIIQPSKFLTEEDLAKFRSGMNWTPYFIREKVEDLMVGPTKEDIVLVDIGQLFTRLMLSWYRRVVKVRMLVDDDEWIATENFYKDIEKHVGDAICFSIEYYRSLRLEDRIKSTIKEHL